MKGYIIIGIEGLCYEDCLLPMVNNPKKILDRIGLEKTVRCIADTIRNEIVGLSYHNFTSSEIKEVEILDSENVVIASVDYFGEENMTENYAFHYINLSEYTED